MKMTTRTIGELSCRLVDNLSDNEKPQAIVVLCHGFGAPGDDLVPLSYEICQLRSQLSSKIQFIFPAAPLNLDHLGMPGARAWWHIDMEALNRAIMSGEYRDQMNSKPEGLDQAREQLMTVIDTLLKETGLSYDQLALGGFSQGAMLATETTLRLPTNPLALLLCSGTLLNQNEWCELMPSRKNLKVVMSHGKQDPLLPFTVAEQLQNKLTEAGWDVDFTAFNGEHSIPLEPLNNFAVLLESLVP